MDPNQILSRFPEAAPWSLWTGQAGKALIFVAITLFAISMAASLLQGRAKNLSKVSSIGLAGGCLAVLGAMGCLVALFAKNQFQYEYVFGHADVHTELKYKIAGVWSGQQGSFLLWACATSIFALLSMWGAGSYRRWYALVFSAFLASLCGILAYETPFNLIHELMQNGKVLVPPTGQGLVPSLQNYWVVIHPPTIFLGFGALTVPFAYAMAAMLSGNVRDWVAYARPWVLVGLSLLGVGLVMGGLWAYETLGWGGFWKWDPVENTSFVPWILMAAFVHGIIVQTTRKRWHGTNLWLGALPFLSFCYGTFLTRSGFLTDVSVHSFAEMDKSALVILEILIGVAVLAFTTLFFVRGMRLAKAADHKSSQHGLNREAAYSFGNLFLALFALVVAIGMSWPFILTKVLQRKAAVIEESLYHQVLVWFFIPLMILMAVGPFISWRTLPLREQVGRFVNVFSLAAGVAGVAIFLIKRSVPMPADPFVATPFGKMQVLLVMALLLFVCTFVAVSSVWRIAELIRRSKVSLGGFVAHLGVATILAGLIVSRGLESHDRGLVQPGQSASLLGYTLTPGKFTADLRDRNNKLVFDVKTPEGEKFEAYPGLYYMKSPEGADSAMVWPHIHRQLSHDVYLTLHEPIITAWKEPLWLKQGETKTQDGITINYLGLHMVGQPGQAGTSFGAKLQVTVDGKTFAAEPKFVVGGQQTLEPVNKDFYAVLDRMEASDKSVAIQLYFTNPVYPIELYYKPLTGLVWIGAGILFLGGIMTAFARRRPKGPLPAKDFESEDTGPAVEETENATVSTA